MPETRKLLKFSDELSVFLDDIVAIANGTLLLRGGHKVTISDQDSKRIRELGQVQVDDLSHDVRWDPGVR